MFRVPLKNILAGKRILERPSFYRLQCDRNLLNLDTKRR